MQSQLKMGAAVNQVVLTGSNQLGAYCQISLDFRVPPELFLIGKKERRKATKSLTKHTFSMKIKKS